MTLFLAVMLVFFAPVGAYAASERSVRGGAEAAEGVERHLTLAGVLDFLRSIVPGTSRAPSAVENALAREVGKPASSGSGQGADNSNGGQWGNNDARSNTEMPGEIQEADSAEGGEDGDTDEDSAATTTDATDEDVDSDGEGESAARTIKKAQKAEDVNPISIFNTVLSRVSRETPKK